NDFSIFESGILSLVNNQKILHDFLYKEKYDNTKTYNSERKRRLSFEYYIGKEKFEYKNLQIEIDLTLENEGYVTIFECKNTKPNKCFNIYQLYNPFRYYYNLKEENKLNIKDLTACYIIRWKNKSNSIVRLYNYKFDNPFDITSIKLIKKKEYHLRKKDFENE
ncbi:MAG: hypothetical protein LBT07_03020, partial [Endomicrobium sp.]|nr:hypothetical protein [Endomicrobium sp.]